MGKLLAPKYYREFKCIADKCTHSCCIGWEIDVDRESVEAYKNLDGYGREVLKSLEFSDNVANFRLLENDRCPHLDGCGLCRIITELGEEHLCDICREHPRFYNRSATALFVGLGLACEEAGRIILSSDDYADFVVTENEVEIDGEDFCDMEEEREFFYSQIKNRNIPYKERLRVLRDTYGIFPENLSDGDWQSTVSSLEYLEESHKTLFSSYSSSTEAPEKYEPILERALAYFYYRHCSEIRDNEEYLSSLGFCFFAERLFASLISSSSLPYVTLARIISEEIEYSEDNTEKIKSLFLS